METSDEILFDQGVLCFGSSAICPELGTEEFAEMCRSRDRRSAGYRFLKRLIDTVFSACVIALGFIPGVILCALIAKDSGGSPIYAQERVGKNGRIFRIFKFRTMVADSDDVEKYLDADQMQQWRLERKVDDDPRITSLGRWLRATSLDEMPNFVNVLKGEMSIVGPRAISQDEIGWFGFEATDLLSVPCGITGLWQTGSRNFSTFESGLRQQIELSYVSEACLSLDAKLFFKTFKVMFEGTGK